MPPDASSPHPTHHVFVDYENVHAIPTTLVADTRAQLTLVIGAKQGKLDVSVVQTLLALGPRASLVHITSSARDAVDIALGYYLGQAVSAHPGGAFHIVSNDAGYDPLVNHLKTLGVTVSRHATTRGAAKTAAKKTAAKGATAPQPPPPPKKAKASPFELASAQLRRNLTARPKRRATLLSHLKSTLGKDATEEDAAALFTQLVDSGVVSVADSGALTYHLA